MVTGKKDAVNAMLRKGYEKLPGAGKDHVRIRYMVKGQRIAQTAVSHGGSKDLTDNLISKMAEDCHLTRQEFLAFARCEMTQEQYHQILIREGVIKE